MLSPLENFYQELDESWNAALQYVREMILEDPEMTESLKWGLPCFDYRGKYMCYFYKHKKHKMPYLAFVKGNKMDHPLLLQEDRKQIRILLLDPEKDLPIETIKGLLTLAKELN